MKTRLVKIGNSRGVRLPATVIEACGFGEELEMRVEKGAVVIEPAHSAREGWDQAFRAMSEAGDDAPLLDEEAANEFDRAEWTW